MALILCSTVACLYVLNVLTLLSVLLKSTLGHFLGSLACDLPSGGPRPLPGALRWL